MRTATPDIPLPLRSRSSSGSARPLEPAARSAAVRRLPAVSVPHFAAVLMAIADVAAAAIAFALSYLIRFEWNVIALRPVADAPAAEYAKLFVLIAGGLAVVARLCGLYRTDFLRSTLEDTYVVAKVVTIAMSAGLAITFFYRETAFSRVMLPLSWALTILLIAATHALYRRWLIGRYAAGLDRRRSIVIGTPSSYLLRRLQREPAFGIDLLGWLGERRRGSRDAAPDAWQRRSDPGEAGALVRSALLHTEVAPAAPHRLGGVDDTRAVLSKLDVQQAVIVEHGLTHEQLLQVIDICEQRGIEVRLIPPIYDLLVDSEDLMFVDGVPLVRVDEARQGFARAILKRMVDIAVAAVVLALAAPIFVIVAIAIKWSSPGPVFFRQLRAGKGGRPFEMLKFRTMVPDAEQRLAQVVDLDRLDEPVFKVAHDPRVTAVGRWLRRSSLDELPQIVNVLKGDMSLVGPRPEELQIVDRYDVWQRRRLKVKPGITGLQQVEARGTLNLGHRVRLDIYYTRKQSLMLDLLILARTVGVVLSGKGAT